MNSKFLKQKYSEWCKETRRNGAVLVGGSIDDFFEWLDESCPPPVSAEVVSADVFYKAISDRINHYSNIHHSYEAQELHDALNVIMRLVPPSQFLHLSPSSKADEMERLKNKLADDFRKNYTLDLNAEGTAEEGFKAGWDKLLVLLQNHPSAKAIAEAAKNTCDIPGCKKIAPQNDIFCKDHRY